MRTILAVLAMTLPLAAQMPPNQNFAPPMPFTPDDATLAAIKAKTADLDKAVNELRSLANSNQAVDGYLKDVEIYLKAAVWITRHNEWYTKDSGKQTLTVLDAGLKRAESLKAGKAPWRDVRGKAVALGYWSPVDGSVQPYSVTYPPGFGTDGKRYLGEINLHGRDASLTEVKFLAGKEGAKENKALDKIVVEIYGRGNNAYRWAGEADVERVKHKVFETISYPASKPEHIDFRNPVIRGFSMGGAGTWHLGLHKPFEFSMMAPGAGFTVTRGYIKNLPEKLPDYVERCLRIYDAADYAENLVNIPCVAYSGEIDPQRAAVNNIEARLKDFPEKLRFTHIIGTGLEHKLPPEWLAKVNEQLDKYRPADDKLPKHVHFVTYTLAYNQFGHGRINGLQRHYDKTVVDVDTDETTMTVKTKNVSKIFVEAVKSAGPARPGGAAQEYISKTLTIDGQDLTKKGNYFKLADGKWIADPDPFPFGKLMKRPGCQGPIDDAFMEVFTVTKPGANAWNADVTKTLTAHHTQFEHVWDKYFRGEFKPNHAGSTQVLFGDPGSNPEIAQALRSLPIKWTKETLEVNGMKYDATTHYPVMIYPNVLRPGPPDSTRSYLVLNSGHTFGEADLKGTNALLYPRLGDWAVMKLTPSKADPHAVEVVDAGIFDENWQFEKKK